jgi:hypothetical protein
MLGGPDRRTLLAPTVGRGSCSPRTRGARESRGRNQGENGKVLVVDAPAPGVERVDGGVFEPAGLVSIDRSDGAFVEPSGRNRSQPGLMNGASDGRSTVVAFTRRRPRWECCTQDRHPQARLPGGGARPGQRRARRGALSRHAGSAREWAMPLQGTVAAVAVEATCGSRWVWRELAALGFEVRLAEPARPGDTLPG